MQVLSPFPIISFAKISCRFQRGTFLNMAMHVKKSIIMLSFLVELWLNCDLGNEIIHNIFFYLIESLQHTNQSNGLLKELDEPFSIKYTMGNKKKK